VSSAFVKESDEQWLQDISPTLPALINYLTRENNGIRVYEQSSRTDSSTGKTIHNMSNGMSYSIDNNNSWFISD